ncbi:MAG: hypothetical protein WCO42_10190 [bacterium]
MDLFPIAASDMDVVIGIIAVVGWVLAQIFGKKKADPSPPEGSTPDSVPSLDPRDELRKFFDELEKTAPPPVAPPPLQQKSPREKTVRRVTESRGETLSSQRRPITLPDESSQACPAMIEPLLSSRTTVRSDPPATMPELRNPAALRKFIIVNEILGKPIALQQG